MKLRFGLFAALAALCAAAYVVVAKERWTPVTIAIATAPDWPVFTTVRVNESIVFDLWHSGGLTNQKPNGTSTSSSEVPGSLDAPLQFDLSWSEYHTGESYVTQVALPGETFEATWGVGGARVAVAYGPFGRFSLWAPSEEMLQNNPLSETFKAQARLRPDILEYQLIHAGCGTRDPGKDDWFSDFLRTGPNHKERNLISPEIATQTRMRLAPCGPESEAEF